MKQLFEKEIEELSHKPEKCGYPVCRNPECKCHKVEEKEGWKERFEKEFKCPKNGYEALCRREQVKSFIQQELDAKEAQVKKELRERIEKMRKYIDFTGGLDESIKGFNQAIDEMLKEI